MKTTVLQKAAMYTHKHSPLLVVPIVCVIFLYGIIVPKDFDVYKKIGFFVIRPYRYGLYLTQQNSNIFYNVSPYQSYFVDGQGNKENLIKWENPIYSQESQLIIDPAKRYQTIVHAVLSYLKLREPSATFVYKQNRLVLTSRVEGNKIAFAVDQNTFTPANSRTLVMTLSYSPEDIIFDENNLIYTQNTPDDTINDLNKALGLKLRRAEDLTTYKTSKRLTIFNKDLNGTISFDVQNNNQGVVNINQQDYLVEFKVFSRGLDKPYIEVEI